MTQRLISARWAGRLRTSPVRPISLRLETLETRLAPVVGAYTDAGLAATGDGLDGVVYLTDGVTLTATGSLLATGRHVLTAAHVVDRDGDRQADGGLSVRFDLPGRTVEMNVGADAIRVSEGWVGLNDDGSIPYSGHDIAILELPAVAPAEADRYELYRGADEVGKEFTVVGYGMAGVGSTGMNTSDYGKKRVGSNTFDSSSLVIGAPIVPDLSALIADFDSGNPAHDAFGVNFGRPNLGLGGREAGVAPGDSGGPALIRVGDGYAVAGVAALYFSGGNADPDRSDNSSFGDYFGYTRASAFASVIDGVANAADTVVVDLSYQAGGEDGTRDLVTLSASGDRIVISVNGDEIQSVPVSSVSAVRVVGTGDGADLAIENGVNISLNVETEGVGEVDDRREEVTSPPPPNQPPVTVPVPGRPTVPPSAPPSDDPDGLEGPGVYAGGGGQGLPTAVMSNADGSVRFRVQPYPSNFGGGVRVATGDVTGDGVPDLITAPGPGISPEVKIYDGVSGSEWWSFLAYESTFTGGVFVAAADFTGDGRADIATSPDFGGGPRVRVIDGSSGASVADFLGIDDPTFRGGARLAAGDLNGDDVADLLVGAGYGGGPRVAAFDGASLRSAPRKLFADFFVFEDSLRNGVFLAAGDIDGDGRAELIAGGGPGGGPRVVALSGGNGTQIVNFFAGDANGRGGVRVAAADLDDDDRSELIAGAGEGAGTSVTVYRAESLTRSSPSAADQLTLGDGLGGGVFVG